MLKRSVCNKLSTLLATPFSNTLFRISSIKPLFCVNKRDAFRGKVLTAQRSHGVASEWFINVIFRLVIRANTGTRRRKTRWQSDLASCCQEHQAYWRKCWANCLHRSTAKKNITKFNIFVYICRLACYKPTCNTHDVVNRRKKYLGILNQAYSCCWVILPTFLTLNLIYPIKKATVTELRSPSKFHRDFVEALKTPVVVYGV